MKGKQRHELASDELLSKIYSGALKPGTKLPTEKQLAEDMGIDRTSLRVALKQLESMQLLEIRQGDGIYVRDYMQNAGLDFLRALIMMGDGKKDHGPVFDVYFIEELWEFWEIFLPQTVILAAKKFSPRDLREVMTILEDELKNIDDREMVVRYEIANQDLMARIANNIVLMLLYNSSRPLREKMVGIFAKYLGKKDLKEHVLAKISLINAYSTGSVEDAVKGAAEYRNLLMKYKKKMLKAMRSEAMHGMKARREV